MPRFFYFDLGNVLLNFDHAIACRQMAEVAGVSPDIVRRIVFDSDLEWRYERGDVSPAGFYDEFCRQSGTRPDYRSFRRAAAAIFEVNARVIPIVGQLRSAGHRLGVLSNTCDIHWEYVTDGRYPVLNEYFEVFALSFQLRSMKPEPTIYAAAAELAGVSPGEIFFVDDRADNVAGARAAGFDAVRYTTAQELERELRMRNVAFNY